MVEQSENDKSDEGSVWNERTYGIWSWVPGLLLAAVIIAIMFAGAR
ncbi:MAG: hypothetical protein AAGF33_07315 [Pseudomonadota bacterium]